MLTWIKNTCIRKCIVEINSFPPTGFPPSLLTVGSCEHNSIFEIPVAFPQHHASHRDSSYLHVHEISMEKSQVKVYFSSCLEYMSPMQPVIKGIWIEDSFTSALETWPTVSLLQTSFFVDCCFLTFVLLPCFSASPITWLSDHRSLPIATQISESICMDRSGRSRIRDL